MTFDWQFWMVIVCVLLAGWRVGLRIWRGMTTAGDASSCGSCPGCATGPRDVDQPLVQLDLSGPHQS